MFRTRQDERFWIGDNRYLFVTNEPTIDSTVTKLDSNDLLPNKALTITSPQPRPESTNHLPGNLRAHPTPPPNLDNFDDKKINARLHGRNTAYCICKREQQNRYEARLKGTDSRKQDARCKSKEKLFFEVNEATVSLSAKPQRASSYVHKRKS